MPTDPPDLPDDYDEESDGPEARLLREDADAEERFRRRTDDLLRAIEREGDPVTQSRRAAERLWDAVKRLLGPRP